jgi:hypothetical protein
MAVITSADRLLASLSAGPRCAPGTRILPVVQPARTR